MSEIDTLVERMEALRLGCGNTDCDVCSVISEARSTLTTLSQHNAKLVEALRGVENRVDWAVSMYHDATRWRSEDGPEGSVTMWDYIFAPINQALNEGVQP